METFQDLIDSCFTPDPPEADPAKRPLPADLRGIPVTFANMIMTDGKETVTGIYRGLMVGAKGQRYINSGARTTVHIATEKLDRSEGAKRTYLIDYWKELTAKYATADWPAVDWSK